MKRVDPAALELGIYIQLRILRGPTRTNLQRIGTDTACKTAARLIIERCLSGFAIFAPDEYYRRYALHEFGSATVGSEWQAGRFGQTEPWPPSPPEPPEGRCRVCGANDIDGLGEALATEMWNALNPDVPFEKAGDHRNTMLLAAHRAINWIDPTHSTGGMQNG